MQDATHNPPRRPEANLAADVMRGLAAGLEGTAAMTLSQRTEMALSGRKPSSSRALAVCKLLGFETRTKTQERRLANEMHWLYGMVWGLGHTATGSLAEPVRSVVYLRVV